MIVKKFFCCLLIFGIFDILASPFITGQNIADSVRIHFKQGRSNLDLSISNNRKALERITDSLKIKDSDSIYRLRKISVVGGASPEGSIKINQKLSEKRANVLFNHLSRFGNLPDSLKVFKYIGRDWQGLLDFVEKDPSVPYRNDVSAMLHDIIAKSRSGELKEHNNVARLQRLKNGKPWQYMYRHIFPKLRSSMLILNYDKVPNPAKLTLLTQKIEFNKPNIQTSLPSITVQPQLFTEDFEYVKETPFYMALKTNMLYDVALVPNVGVEFYLGRNFSISADWEYAWWNSDSSKWYWRIYGGDIAVKKWFGRKAEEKPLTGHHAGIYLQTLTYDFETGGRGYMAGEPGGTIFDRANYVAGVEYGYSLPIARRLNIDFTLGIGYMWGKYYEYLPIDNCYVWQATKKRSFFGPTKLGVSLVWLLGRGNYNAGKGGKKW